jgi:hypothetical protein
MLRNEARESAVIVVVGDGDMLLRSSGMKHERYGTNVVCGSILPMRSFGVSGMLIL